MILTPEPERQHKICMFKQIFNFLKGHRYSPSINSQNSVDGDGRDDDKATASEAIVQERPAESIPGPKRRAKDLLAEYGVKRVKSQDDVNRIFWEMATRRMPITKNIANAIRIVITSGILNHPTCF